MKQITLSLVVLPLAFGVCCWLAGMGACTVATHQFEATTLTIMPAVLREQRGACSSLHWKATQKFTAWE